MKSTLSTTDVPTRIADYRAESIGEEIMLYSEEKTEAVYLNQAASVVWLLCDSTNTVGDIIDSIRTHYGEEPAGELSEEIISALDELSLRDVISIR